MASAVTGTHRADSVARRSPEHAPLNGDVTDRRTAESARRRLASIVEFSNDAIITVALDSRITTWNPAAERMSGYTAEEAVGQPVSIIAPPDAPDQMPRMLERIRAGREISHFEVHRVGKEGREADLLALDRGDRRRLLDRHRRGGR